MSRYSTYMLVSSLGVLLVVGSQAFAPVLEGWLAFGVANVVLGTLALAQLDSRRGMAQRLLDAALGSISAVLLVFSLVFGGATAWWLAFGLVLGFIGAVLAGITLHEVENWRSAHGFLQPPSLARPSHGAQPDKPGQPSSPLAA